MKCLVCFTPECAIFSHLLLSGINNSCQLFFFVMIRVFRSILYVWFFKVFDFYEMHSLRDICCTIHGFFLLVIRSCIVRATWAGGMFSLNKSNCGLSFYVDTSKLSLNTIPNRGCPLYWFLSRLRRKENRTRYNGYWRFSIDPHRSIRPSNGAITLPCTR